MASRRDELNAYTFAKRRTLASFLQPSPSGSEEGAPRPLRAIVPGAVVGIVVLAVFGAVGLFSPTAPKGWDEAGGHVIVASDSTTRYVVLKTDGKKQLHPVLNMASAKLLLDPGKDGVITVDEGVLDSGEPPHGATIGIPYAPDRLPGSGDAEQAKRWAVCERPGPGGRAVQKAAFVLAEKDWRRTEGRNRLTGGDLMYVVGPDGTSTYVVDSDGSAYPLADPADKELLKALDTQGRDPQRVSQEWLDALHKGDPIDIPEIKGTPGATAGASDALGQYDKVGMVIKAYDGRRMQYYVVQSGTVARVSEFTATLLLNSGALVDVGQAGEAQQVSPGAVVDSVEFEEQRNWPSYRPKTVNDATSATSATPATSGRNTVCNVLRSVNAKNGSTILSTWAGTDFPAPLPTGSSSAYVTPGSGQLYRQFQGSETKAGGVFLVTDTGLRYALQSNSDSATDDKGIGTSDKKRAQQLSESRIAQTRLGYENVEPSPVPVQWSTFLPTGPRLSESAARRPQGS